MMLPGCLQPDAALNLSHLAPVFFSFFRGLSCAKHNVTAGNAMKLVRMDNLCVSQTPSPRSFCCNADPSAALKFLSGQ